jgi:hypothetical protein
MKTNGRLPLYKFARRERLNTEKKLYVSGGIIYNARRRHADSDS